MKLGKLLGLQLPGGTRPEVYLEGVGWELVDRIEGEVVIHVGSARYRLSADLELPVRGGCESIRASRLGGQHCGGRWEYSLEGADWRVLRELDCDDRKVGLVDVDLCIDWVYSNDSVWIRPIVNDGK